MRRTSPAPQADPIRTPITVRMPQTVAKITIETAPTSPAAASGTGPSRASIRLSVIPVSIWTE